MSPSFRAVPDDFLAVAATMRPHSLCKHYNCGPAVIRRWLDETGAPEGPDKRLRTPEPPAADFATLAPGMTISESKLFWKRGETTLRRWEEDTGVRMLREGRLRPIPADFKTLHATMAIPELAKHYRTCKSVVRRWAGQAGVARRHGVRIRLAKSEPFVRAAPEKKRPKPASASGAGNRMAPVDHVQRDMSRAGQAADYLRRYAPVTRCDEHGRYNPDGAYWRRGSTVLDAEAIVERAIWNGWMPDAWRMVA